MIGRDIHDFLVKKKITAIKLADAVDITAVQLSRIINGHSMPSRITMEKIAKALDVDLAFSCDNGQWSLVSKFSGMRIRPVYTDTDSYPGHNPNFSNSMDIISIPVLAISEISDPAFSDQANMEKLFSEASSFIPVPLSDLGKIGPRKPYAVVMNGSSMCDAGIPYGAYATINPDESIYNGDPVLAKWGTKKDITIRWLFEYNDQIKLCSSNPIKYPPIVLDKPDFDSKENEDLHNNYFTLYGKVMAVYSKPHKGI